MKPNLILHIGTEKTGTSTIQEFLYQNRKELEENGYHFLQCAGPKNNRALPAYVLNDTDSLNDDFFQLNSINTIEGVSDFRNEFNKKINEEIKKLGANIHTVIISSEHFHSRVNKLESIQRLKDLTDTLFSKVTVVCYLREQSQVCESWYSTALKNGHTSTFANFVQNCNVNNIYFNYQKNLQNWMSIYNKNINVRVFDRGSFFEGDLLKDFSYACGIDGKSTLNYRISIENESISTTGQHLLYSINNLIKKTNNNKEISKLKSSAKIIIENQKGKGQKITKNNYLRIVDEFSKSNKNLFNSFSNLIDYEFPRRDLNQLPEDYENLEKDFYFELVKNLTTSRLDLSSDDTDRLRDIALSMEESGDCHMALELMEIAKKSRPNGPLIDKKIKEYKLLIKQKTN